MLLIPFLGQAQEKKIDGVAAVVGDEVILDSDIQRDYLLAKQQGMEVPDKCAFVSNVLLQKMVLHHAKNDTLVEVANERIKQRAISILEDFRTRGSDEELLSVYGVRTIPELQKELEILVKENALIEQKKGLIEKDVDASPEEVKVFFNENKNQLPRINEEVELSHIVIYPEITEAHEQEIIDRLLAMKKEIEEGASFETKAILYSEDPGSKNEGGLYKGIKRGTFVPEFDAVAFNLEEGEISEPVETEFGFHLIQLEKRLGQAIDVRHILIQPKPNAEEMAEAKERIERIKREITGGDITFKEAAKKYSVDKYTRYNAGVMTNPQTGENRFERSKLDTKQIYAIAGLDEGVIANPFESEHNKKKSYELLKLVKVIPAHQIDLDTDYMRLKNMTIRKNKQAKLFDWIEMNLPDTFIKIHSDYANCDFELNWLKK